jgi:hypothetical protein
MLALSVAGGLLAAVLGAAAAGAWRTIGQGRAAAQRARALGAALGLEPRPMRPPGVGGHRSGRGLELRWRATHPGERIDHDPDGDGVPVDPKRPPARLRSPLHELQIAVQTPLQGPGRLTLRLPPGQEEFVSGVYIKTRGEALTIARLGPLEVGVSGQGPAAEAQARAELDRLIAEVGAPVSLPASAPELHPFVDALAADPHRWAGLGRPGAPARLLRLLRANAPFDAAIELQAGALVWSSLDTDGLDPRAVGAIADELIALVDLLEKGAPPAP